MQKHLITLETNNLILNLFYPQELDMETCGITSWETKWVIKIKCQANGALDKFKARLVAHGFEQQKGIDYEETFILVIKWGTIYLMVALAFQ